MPKSPPSIDDPLRLDRLLMYRLHAISRLSDRESSAGYLRECGLSLSEGRCLATIGSFEPLSLQDLARSANQDKAQASRAATSLVERGLIDKSVSENDGRGVVLTLTAAGKPVFRRAMKLIASRDAAIFGTLSDDENLVLGALLDRVTVALREQAGDGIDDDAVVEPATSRGLGKDTRTARVPAARRAAKVRRPAASKTSA